MNMDMSVIAPDESQGFMDHNEHNSIFGTGNIGPDRIRMSMVGGNGGNSGAHGMLNDQN